MRLEEIRKGVIWKREGEIKELRKITTRKIRSNLGRQESHLGLV